VACRPAALAFSGTHLGALADQRVCMHMAAAEAMSGVEGVALAAPITAAGDGIYDGPRVGSLALTDARGLPRGHGTEVADDDSAVSSHDPPVVERFGAYLSQF
jgi:hypothetical protein